MPVQRSVSSNGPWPQNAWLVTGGAGFIGSHLVGGLLARGQRVVVLDDFSSGTEANLEAVRAGLDADACGRLRVMTGDIRERAAVDAAMVGVDFVLHHAAKGSVPESLDQPALYQSVNVDGTFHVMEAARAQGVRGLVFASSAAVYGDDDRESKVEDHIGRMLSPYAMTKRIAEQMLQTWASAYGFPGVALRYFNVVGARQDPEGAYAAVVPRWLAALRRGERLIIYGDGLTSRDFCPVGAVVEANVLAARVAQQRAGRVYNVALGRRTTLLDLFATLRDGLAARGLPCGDLEPIHQDFRAGDIRHSLADIARARAELAFDPDPDVVAGLQPALDAAVKTVPEP